MAPKIGERYRFIYSELDEPIRCADYLAHSGQVVVVTNRLVPADTGYAVNAFEVTARDGWQGEVGADELSPLTAERRMAAPTKRKALTDKSVRALKAAAPGKRYDTYDALVPGLLVRTTSTGHKTFALRAKFPGHKNRARRELGEFGRLTCDEARAKARRWLSSLAEGVDPVRAERREQGRATTFAAAVEQWLAECVRGQQRQGARVEREIKTYLLPKWGSLPVANITRDDVKELVKAIRFGGIKGEGPAPYQAHAVLGHIRVFFGWAVDEGPFGLAVSPAAGIKPAKLIGEKKPRQRKLSDDELRAFWRATGNMAYPHGPLLRLLLLTGCRNSEVRCARWSEFDFTAKVWRVPEERFKSESEHLVVLSGDAVALLSELPRFQHGDFLFTSSFGRKPVGGLGRTKVELDKLMRAELGELRPFVIHDLRRTVRTRLASLRVPDETAEMCLGHGRKGLQRVYDLHHYEPEMRDALERWAARLRSIVAPPEGDNVVPLREAVR